MVKKNKPKSKKKNFLNNNNIENDNQMSINVLSLTPQPEMASSTTLGISKLINKLHRDANKLVKIYRENRLSLKKNPKSSRIIANKINKTISNIKDINEYISSVNKKKYFREFSIKNGKAITKKKLN
tara:strand:- start:483 stop:863 length:381 start_codon:yes stop_codon:yes gene_type:complete